MPYNQDAEHLLPSSLKHGVLFGHLLFHIIQWYRIIFMHIVTAEFPVAPPQLAELEILEYDFNWKQKTDLGSDVDLV